MIISKFTSGLNRYFTIAITLTVVFITSGFSFQLLSVSRDNSEKNDLAGAWRGKVQFKSGVFASVSDLEFMYVFNEGGTMTESSNYDGVPPVPPAYGIWRKTGDSRFEAKYTFYTTRPPKNFDEIGTGGGWMPAGYGILFEKISMAPDGKSFTSTLTLELYDQSGKPADGGGEAETSISRIEF